VWKSEKKSWSRKVFVLRVQTELHESVSRRAVLRVCLTVSYLESVIYPRILGVRLCMSPILECKVYGSLGCTPCPGLSPNIFVAIISISLCIQLSVFSGLCLAESTFGNSISSSITYVCKLDSCAHILWVLSLALKPGMTRARSEGALLPPRCRWDLGEATVARAMVSSSLPTTDKVDRHYRQLMKIL
jgi:hypothetical protein